VSDPAVRAISSPALPKGPGGAAPVPPKLHKVPHRWPVVLIGLGKLLKAAALVYVAYLLQLLMHNQKHQEIEDWVTDALIQPHNFIRHHVYGLLEKLLGVSVQTLRVFHVGVIIYSGLFLIEGVGLIFDKKWAEWMVVITTVGYIPFELYEIYESAAVKHEMNWVVLILFVLNMIVLSYLCFRLRRMAVLKRENRAIAAINSEA